MKIIVTGLESSGTKWMAHLLSKHPGVSEVVHTSIPEHYMPNTRWPNLKSADAVVWMIRYEPFRLKSVARERYDANREARFLPPVLYLECEIIYANMICRHFVSYESLVGPLGKLVLADLLSNLSLSPVYFPWEEFKPNDGNAKYLEPTCALQR